MADNGGVIPSKLFPIIANYRFMNEAVVNCDSQINTAGVTAGVKQRSQHSFRASN